MRPSIAAAAVACRSGAETGAAVVVFGRNRSAFIRPVFHLSFSSQLPKSSGVLTLVNLMQESCPRSILFIFTRKSTSKRTGSVPPSLPQINAKTRYLVLDKFFSIKELSKLRDFVSSSSNSFIQFIGCFLLSHEVRPQISIIARLLLMYTNQQLIS